MKHKMEANCKMITQTVHYKHHQFADQLPGSTLLIGLGVLHIHTILLCSFLCNVGLFSTSVIVGLLVFPACQTHCQGVPGYFSEYNVITDITDGPNYKNKRQIVINHNYPLNTWPLKMLKHVG